MSFSDGFHKFLDAIGIVSSDDPNAGARGNRDDKYIDKDYQRRSFTQTSKTYGDYAGRDFAPSDDDDEYKSSRVTRFERSSAPDSYRGYSRSDNDAPSASEIDNMVEFKNVRRQPGAALQSDRVPHTVIHYLRGLDDCDVIIDELLNENQVVLNIEDTDETLKRRALDTIYGASYALGAKMRQASRETYLIAPSSVVLNDADETSSDKRAGGFASNIRDFRG